MTARAERRKLGKRLARKQDRKAIFKAVLRQQRGGGSLPGTGKRK